MIISIHVPHTAGTSFRMLLREFYGERLFLDYGDWVGYNTRGSMRRRERRSIEISKKKNELLRDFNAIHGHFTADKYRRILAQASFAAFFRDPFQQTVSDFECMKRYPNIRHPALKVFHDLKPDIVEYIRCPIFQTSQMEFLGSLSLSDLEFVGLTEEFEISVELFNRTFGAKLSATYQANVNPNGNGRPYPIDHDLRKEIARYRSSDVELYERAKERFSREVARRAG